MKLNTLPFAPESTLPITGQPHVYILPTHQHDQLKIGRSIDPLGRIAGLTNIYPNIDLTRAVILGVDSHRIETVLHTVFGCRRIIQKQRVDGYTEWFRGDFVEEALALAQKVAQHRGTDYRVFGNVAHLLQTYRTQYPNAGQRTPRRSKAERSARAPFIESRLQEAILDHTQRFIDTLCSEREFDAIVHYAGNAYLARTVYLSDEPECWLGHGGFSRSVWGNQLARLAQINVQVEGGSCSLHLINPPIFSRLDGERGREYFRISERHPNSAALGKNPPSLTDPAFAELWRALDHLPKVEVACDPLGAAGCTSTIVADRLA
jgi:hypothetical protein